MKLSKKELQNNSNSQNIKKAFILGLFILSWIPTIAKAPYLSAEELLSPPPRIIRTCCSFGSNVGFAVIPFVKETDITSIQNMGSHQYMGCKDEQNGNIYTKSGGFIDMGHVRDCADWTAYLYNLILSGKNKVAGVTKVLGREGGLKTLLLYLPPELDSLMASELAGKIAYDLSLWHEISTWYGSSYIPFVPERYSSFSPEDLYSNLLGVTLGIQALRSDLEYNDAMTQLIAKMLDSLECVATVDETFTAMEKVEDVWWTRDKRLPSKKILLKRFMDSDTYLTPWLLPEDTCDFVPHKIEKPASYLSDLYELRIKLNHKFPVKRKFSAQLDKTITSKDFDVLKSYIEQDVDKLNQKVAIHSQRSNIRKENRLTRKMRTNI